MTYEIRAMTLGEILDTSFRIVRNHFGPLVGMAAVVYVPYYVVMLALQSGMQSQIAGGGSPGGIGGIIAGYMGSLLTFVIVGPIVSAAIYHAISEAYVGRPVQVQASLRVALGILLPLLGTSILNFLGTIAAFCLLIIPVVWFALGMTVLTPINVVERSFGVPSIRRSLDLMKGNRGRAFLLYMLVLLISIVLGAGLGLIGLISPWIGGVAQGFASAVASVFGGAMNIVLYFDIRCRKEAFDIEHLARQVQSDGAAA